MLTSQKGEVMKHTEMEWEKRRQQVFYCMSSLPKKMLMCPDSEHLAELVLYDLSHPHCFNLSKSAFFIDNPDFDCLQGIAGVAHNEVAFEASGEPFANVWEAREQFANHMRASSFNTLVRSLSGASLQRSGKHIDEEIAKFISPLSLQKPVWRVFKTKHGNQGILVFEAPEHPFAQEDLALGAAFLGFCPIV